MLPIESYLALRERPAGRALMRQRWHNLTFLHFSVEPEVVQATLPNGLVVDTFPNESGEERAWIGLVPFTMSGIRFERMPQFPGCSAFPETNVRTYVHRDGEEPGVWFYSLDAANPVACSYARRVFGLPYHHASMWCRATRDHVSYSSLRGDVHLVGKTVIGGELAAPEPGSFEFFLVERYLLYTVRRGALFKGQVHHPPYSVQAANYTGQDSLVQAVGLTERPWESILFSPGVEVEVFGLQKV